MFFRDEICGQVLIEFVLFLCPVVILLVLAGRLFHDEWNLAQCAHLTFEATHARRIGLTPARSSFSIRVEEESDRWRGRGVCGNSKETVELPKLEAAIW